MILQDAISECIRHGTHCVTRSKYAERRTLIEVREGAQTLKQHSWALPTIGLDYCPTLEDLEAHDWEIVYPEDHA